MSFPVQAQASCEEAELQASSSSGSSPASS